RESSDTAARPAGQPIPANPAASPHRRIWNCPLTPEDLRHHSSVASAASDAIDAGAAKRYTFVMKLSLSLAAFAAVSGLVCQAHAVNIAGEGFGISGVANAIDSTNGIAYAHSGFASHVND